MMEMGENTEIGFLLRVWRKRRKLTLGDTAAQAGVARSTLTRWEQGQTLPRLDELERTLSVLGVSRAERDAALRGLNARRFVAAIQESDAAAPVSGHLLRAMRLRQGRTQSDVAQAVGVSQGTIAKWERSEEWPSPERLHRLCFFLVAQTAELTALLNGRFLPAPPFSSFAALHDFWESTRLTALGDLAFLLVDSAFASLPQHSEAAKEMHFTTHYQYAVGLVWNMRYEETARVTERALRLHPAPRALSPGIIAVNVLLLQSQRKRPSCNFRRGIAQLKRLMQATAEHDLQAWLLMEIAVHYAHDGEYEAALHFADQSESVPIRDGSRRADDYSAWMYRVGLMVKCAPADALVYLRNEPPQPSYLQVHAGVQKALSTAEANLALRRTEAARTALDDASADFGRIGSPLYKMRCADLLARCT